MKLRKYARAGAVLIGIGIGSSIGAKIANDAGSQDAAVGISKLASYAPLAGSIIGAGMALNALKMIKPPRRK